MASLKIVTPVLITLLIVLFTFSEAREFVVGGHENSWSFPTSSDSLNGWAQKERFEVGDILFFAESDPLIDSVLEVTKDDYDKCYVSNPIKEHTDVNTKVELDRSGPFYFISNAVVSCEKGQKLTVVVLHKHPKPPPPPGHAASLAPLSSSQKGPAPSQAQPAPPPKNPAPSPAPLSQPPTAGAFGLRGGFVGIVVGIMSLVRIVFV
ncbi:early nodulin-like protein 1 [Quercus lobata]|uniref:early nodulin-like protein 1 n=1 Tax=Quercus lobata TaxID=97700 RepID=UPI00124861D2|nr:early nodulin-like protein 1 [Quercus lobata]